MKLFKLSPADQQDWEYTVKFMYGCITIFMLLLGLLMGLGGIIAILKVIWQGLFYWHIL